MTTLKIRDVFLKFQSPGIQRKYQHQHIPSTIFLKTETRKLKDKEAETTRHWRQEDAKI